LKYRNFICPARLAGGARRTGLCQPLMVVVLVVAEKINTLTLLAPLNVSIAIGSRMSVSWCIFEL
jgi:hypothetical protein